MREVSQIGCPRHDLPDAHRRKDIIDKQADDKEDGTKGYTRFAVDEAGRMTEDAAKSWASWQYQTLVRYGAKPYIYNPLIHGLNPLDEKGEEERP
tara:strand:+ start:1553 stop:1837 length:285 start_codon:yes stop_codon:yes gene_type:complete